MASDLQSFIAKVKTDGLLIPNRFEIRIPGLFGSESKDMSLLCDNIQWPGKTISSASVPIFGESREFPTGTIEYDQVSLSFICDRNLRVLEAFNKWHMQAFNTKSRKLNYYSSYVRDVEITILDKKENSSNQESTRKITLKECWPKVIGSFDIAHGLESPLRLRVTLAYKWFEDNLTVNQSTTVQKSSTSTPRYATTGGDSFSSSSNFGGGFGGISGQESTSLIDFSGGGSPMRSFTDTLGSVNAGFGQLFATSSRVKNDIATGTLPSDGDYLSDLMVSATDNLYTGTGMLKQSIDTAIAKAGLGIPNLSSDSDLLDQKNGPLGILNGARGIQSAIGDLKNIVDAALTYENTPQTFKNGSGFQENFVDLSVQLEETREKLDTVETNFDEFMMWKYTPSTPSEPIGSYTYELDPAARGTPEFQSMVESSLNITMSSLSTVWETMNSSKVVDSRTNMKEVFTIPIVEKMKNPNLSLARNTYGISGQISNYF